MSKKQIITIISTVITAIIIAIAAVLIINKNNRTTKMVVAEQNMKDNENIDVTSEPTEDSEDPEDLDNPDEIPSKKPSAKPKTSSAPKVSGTKYYIKVNNQMNTVTVYAKDQNGNYTIPVRAMVCSTGYASPKNSKYQLKGRWNWGKMFGGVYTQYETLITGNILFHSVPYLRQYDHSSLEYWEYDKLGTTCSAGCIRLTTRDAKWIYDNCERGTWVEFYSSSNPGPLGKPSAMKISSSPNRNWDPTDPDPNNPWRNANVEIPEANETIPVEPSEEPIVPTVVPTIDITEPTTTPVSPTEEEEEPITTPTAIITPSETASSEATAESVA